MNIGEEKKYVYSMMSSVTEERRRLTDIYYGLKDRLDELNKLESRGLDSLDVKGYVDLHNENNKAIMVENIKRETKKVIDEISSEKKEEKEETLKDKVKKEVVMDSLRRPRENQISIERVISVITTILREYGLPMSTSNLYERVNEKFDGAIKEKNFRNNMLYRIGKMDNNIERVGRGFYQFVNK